jgi:hypothetical protein
MSKLGFRLLSAPTLVRNVVLERDHLPQEAGEASMLQYQGKFYHYSRIASVMGRVESDKPNAYAEFLECEPPYEVQP